MAALTGFFTALPQLVSLLTEVWTYLNKVSGNDPAGYISKVGAAFATLNAAQTEQDYTNAAKAIAESLASMPSK